jgi:large subunit ribosomal protein L27e
MSPVKVFVTSVILSIKAVAMGKFLKTGRIVVLLQGRQAGKKAVIVKSFEEGTKTRPYAHALVAGIERHPLKITKRMSQKKIAKRSRVKPFLKIVNFNHVMATRYTLPQEIDAKKIATEADLETKEARETAKKNFKQLLQEKFENPPVEKSGKASKDFLFLKNKLRF